MAHEEQILELLNVLKITDDKTVGEIMAYRGVWTAGISARNQSNRAMKELSDQGKIEKCSGFFRTLDCKSEYKDHARLLTACLAEILKTPYNPIIYREKTFPNGLRSDAVVLLKHHTKARCFILEVCHTETYEYLKGKHDEWLRQGVSKTLSNLFGFKIPYAAFCVEGKEASWATPLKEVLK